MTSRQFLGRLLVGAVAGLLVPTLAVAENKVSENWPAWRGPRGDGTSRETGLPLRWSETENVRWKTPIPGTGHSSPVVWEDRIFLTSCIEKTGDRLLLCLSRKDGRILWQKTVLTAPLERKHGENSFASSTPATDGKHLWVAFLQKEDMIAACYDLSGNEVWRKSPGKLLSRHGFCSSPILWKNLVILNGDQDAQAYLVALEKETGKEVWRADRPNRTRSYCAPLIVEAAGKTQMVLSGSKCVTSYDPATGKLHWILDGPTEQYVASLVHTRGIFFLTTGFPEYHLMGIRDTAEGNITGTRAIAWHHRKLKELQASYVPSPVAVGDYFYVVSDKGLLSCYHAETGKLEWSQKLGRRHRSSLVAVDGHLLVSSDEGDTWVVKAGPRFELVAKNRLDEGSYASHAVSHGDLLIRTFGHVYCLSVNSKAKK